MRFILVLIGLGLLAGTAQAQETVVQAFSATGALTTPSFAVQDKWELRWDCPDVIAMTLLAPDGTIVAGTSGSLKGSLFEQKGGIYYLQVSRTTQGSTLPWHVIVVELGANAANGEFYIPSNYVPPPSITAPTDTNAVATPAGPTTSAKTVLAGTNATSTSAPPTNTAPTAPAPPVLTEDQARAVVLVKGDVGEGTGFLVKMPDGPAVITNQHVIASNPNLKITTTSGAQVKVTGLKGASDRDLAMILIQDDHYSYLDLASDIKDTVQPGDNVITPGNSEGGEVMLNTKGTVLGLGPEKVEISNPIYHGNSGGPVFHSKSAKVIAVVTQGMKVIPSDDLDKASSQNQNSAITGSMRYFGLRLDTVPTWEVYDWNVYLTQTTFLKNFHDVSRCLDSYLNGINYEKEHLVNNGENGPPNAQYFLQNEKIVRIRDNFRRMTADAGESQNLEACRQLVFDLDGVADTDLETIQNPANFYSFNETRAQEEIKYRKALRDEVERIGNKVSDLGH